MNIKSIIDEESLGCEDIDHLLIHQVSLVGGDWNHGILWLSHHIENVIIPTDELHHFSEGIPPNQ